MTTATRSPQRTQRPPMDARIRQRRIDVRRAGLRRRRRVILSCVVAVVLAIGGFAVTRSPLFAITDVRVEGVEGRQARAILAAAEIRRGENLLSADLEMAVARTTALPWVASATARREPPSTVVIAPVVRRPVAILRTGHGRWLVDGDGVVIAQAGRQRLPRIDVTAQAVAVPGSRIDDPATHNALAVHTRLPRDVRAAARTVEAVGERTVRLELALAALDEPGGFQRGQRTWVRMGAAGDVSEQVAVLRALLEQLRRGRGGVPSEIDVRVPANPVVVP